MSEPRFTKDLTGFCGFLQESKSVCVRAAYEFQVGR
jgi:hypothetical protein